ncbi:MAG: PIN-like domain-containing protein, partial [Bacteroidota bacterium]
MKSKFPGYFKLTEEEINQLWEKALFVFDANILLNLYRYSNETRDDFFKILEKIK